MKIQWFMASLFKKKDKLKKKYKKKVWFYHIISNINNFKKLENDIQGGNRFPSRMYVWYSTCKGQM